MMQLYSLKCPHCGSDLEVEDGLDTFYCKFCGGKVQMSGLSKEAYKAKVRVKELDHEQRIREKELELELEKLKQQKRNRRMSFISDMLHNDLIVGFGAMVGLILLLLLLALFVK